MASAPTDADDELFDEFLTDRGHQVQRAGWERDYNKKKCPECSGLHDSDATSCNVCGWSPR